MERAAGRAAETGNIYLMGTRGDGNNNGKKDGDGDDDDDNNNIVDGRWQLVSERQATGLEAREIFFSLWSGGGQQY